MIPLSMGVPSLWCLGTEEEGLPSIGLSRDLPQDFVENGVGVQVFPFLVAMREHLFSFCNGSRGTIRFD